MTAKIVFLFIVCAVLALLLAYVLHEVEEKEAMPEKRSVVKKVRFYRIGQYPDVIAEVWWSNGLREFYIQADEKEKWLCYHTMEKASTSRSANLTDELIGAELAHAVRPLSPRLHRELGIPNAEGA